ncbi:hypothetical protein [Thiomicrorhabdus indica]|uniref:hypothetical protein n=1 Tax=Thiomicrorhabdus indica TaxID=2267253 RepID=UPI00102DBCB5|nr:hypothetical protein [Thiomicrorhabdus indica]
MLERHAKAKIVQANQNQTEQLNSHVYRVFQIFDNLYQFGATDYFARFLGVEEGYRIFSEALKGVSIASINKGVERVKLLENRKPVFPDSKAFFKLCVMSDQEFSENRYLYEN